ncbi:MAG: hypothetical protein KJN67_04320, partial [Pontiella sp.]|nr:hypothetical protein [Pontiella sp.]
MLLKIFNLQSSIECSAETYRIPSCIKSAILLLPFILMVLFAILLLLPSTRSVGLWLLQENHPIELGTAFILFAGCAVSMVRAVKIRKVGGTFIIYGFYIVFGMGLLFVAMEELAWGQWLFGFETPEACKVINRQGETTLHNLVFFQGHSEFTRMTFGLGALA